MNDLQKRLEIAKKMAIKNPALNSRVKIIEKMIEKGIIAAPTDELVYATQPAYLMTKEEYLSKVSPILYEYNKFIKKNNKYLVQSDWGGIFYYTFDEALEDVLSGNPKTNRFIDTYKRKMDATETENYNMVLNYWNYHKFGDFGIETKPELVPEEVTKQKREYMARLAPFFTEEEIYRTIYNNDELKTNRWAVRRAIDKGYYKELFKNGTLTEERLNEIALSTGVTMPKSVYTDVMLFDKDLKKEIDKAVVEKNIVKLTEIAEQMKVDFEPVADEVYKRETQRYLDNINKLLNDNDFKSTSITKLFPLYHRIFESETRYVDDTVLFRGRLRKVEEIRIVQLRPDYLKTIHEVVSNYVASLPYALIKSVFTYLIREPKEISSYNMESLQVGYKGYEGLFKFTFIDGSSLLLSTHAIGAGGYNIQEFHYRYLTNIIKAK